MLKNYIKITLRHIFKNKTYSLVNVVSLSVGIATSVLILMFVLSELSYDKFHEKSENTYRINEQLSLSDKPDLFPMLPYPAGPTLVDEFPEVENSVRIMGYKTASQVPVIRKDDKRFYEKNFAFTEPSFFEVFDFSLLQGDEVTALEGPNKVILTESMAIKYFEGIDVIGKTLTIDGSIDLEVTGVIPDFPNNSHLQFDFLASLSTIINNQLFPIPNFEQNWDTNWYWTYVVLNPGSSAESLEAKLPKFVQTHFSDEMKKNNPKLVIEALEDIHLYSNITEGAISPLGNILYIYIFFTVGIGILVIASINYMNLATARFSQRALEVGVKKVLGAEKSDLRKQFLAEAVVVSFISGLLALALVEFLLPYYGNLTGKSFESVFALSNWILPLTLIISVIVGLLSGTYPSIFLSAMQPVKVLGGKFRGGMKSGFLRKALVVSQFAISMILVISTFTVYKQLTYMQEKDLGFNKDQIVMLKVFGTNIIGNLDAFKNNLKAQPSIKNATSMNANLGEWVYSWFFEIEGEEESKLVPFLETDFDFVETMDIDVKEGRGFDINRSTDSTAFLVNSAFVKKFDLKEPLGKYLRLDFEGNERGQIIGVVDNFHFESLQKSVGPLIVKNGSLNPVRVAVKLAGGNFDEAINNIESVWNQFEQERPFNFYFLDEQINQLYNTEKTMANVFTLFSVIAIFVACIGLLGLTAFAAEQRKKEIGIRKSLGASVSNIIILFTKEFTLLFLAANIFAWPIAYYLMNTWLNNFAYAEQLSLLNFILSSILLLAIAFGAISYHVVKAANQNPVDSIKYE